MRSTFVISFFLLLIFIFSSLSSAALSEHELTDQLRADYVIFLQARTEFEQSYPQGKPGSNAQDDFAAWIKLLSDQLVQGCREILTTSSKPLPADLPCDELISRQSTPAAINIMTESTEAEKTSRMIDELNGSLGEFDELLLREQDRVKERKPWTEKDSAASGSGDSGAGSDGAAGDSDGGGGRGKGGRGKSGSDKSASESGKAASVEEGQPGSSTEKGGKSRSIPSRKSSAPADIPNGSNDDVVARQIREAAEKETDPELKKKLWDEYRRYKSGEL